MVPKTSEERSNLEIAMSQYYMYYMVIESGVFKIGPALNNGC